MAFDMGNGKNLRDTMVVLPTLQDNFVWKHFLILSYKHTPKILWIQRESRLLNDLEGHGMPLAVFYIESEKQSACDGNIIGRHADPCRPGQGTIIIREGMDPVRSAENVVRPQRVLSHYTMMGVYIGKLDQCRAMMYRKGEKMTEEGTLSIVMLENTYKVRYASNNPHSMDRQPYKCTDEAKLGAFLQHLEIDAWYIQQAFAELWKGGFVALPIRLSAEQLTVRANEHRFLRIT